MIIPEKPQRDAVDELLRNAQLRDELEPLLDESVTWVDTDRLPVRAENDFLESMLAWERAPMVPISQWYEPELRIPAPDSLGDEELRDALWELVFQLYEKRIVLDFTDHLSDRALYRLIYRDILPSHEKKIIRSDSFLHWDCLDCDAEIETWLRYYATPDDRRMWLEHETAPLPPRDLAPYPRKFPRAPL